MLPAVQRRLSDESHKLDMLEQRARLLDPSLLLKRGYSITLYNGKTVRSAEELKEGALITTRFETGEIESKVERLKKMS
jgi:exodeoxyribonuclease VII, large subunit